LHIIVNDKLQKILEGAPQLCMLQMVGVQQGYGEFCSLQSKGLELIENEQLQALLQQYSDVFKEPTSLALKREVFDHRIPLKQGTNPFNIRPYRYPLK